MGQKLFIIVIIKQIGLEFRESNLMINAKNEKIIQPGMVFNIIVAVTGLKSLKNKNYAIHISDIAIVN